MRKVLTGLSVLAAALVLATVAHADAITGTLYYTTFGGGTNVWKIDFNYDGTTTVTYSNDTAIKAMPGADGIVFDPVSGQLLIGGQSSQTYKLNQGTGTFVGVNSGSGVASYHLSIDPDLDTVWVANCCGGGNLGEVPLNPFAAGTGHDVTGGDTYVDTLAWVPNGQGGYTTWYTASGAGGDGCIGTINMTTFVTTRVTCLDASHGMAYDPFSNNLILMGDNHITQFNPFTNTIIGDRVFAETFNFDQGSVDGKGHIFAADNNGYIVFLDYSGTGDIDSAFLDAHYLKPNLDDLAPLVGPGSRPVPEPGVLSLSVLGIGAALRRLRRRG